MRWAHPEYFRYLILVLLPAALFLFYIIWRARGIKRLGDEALVSTLMPARPKGRPYVKFALLSLAFILIIFGLANLLLGTTPLKVKRRSMEIVIALDISRSMQAQDLKPSRLERTKQFISKFLETLGGDEVALTVFADHAYMQMPLTIDYPAAKLVLSSINTDMAPAQGTAIAEAISQAQSSFNPDSKSSKIIMLFSDGEDHEGDIDEQAESAEKDGIHIYTFGAGSETGSPIPLYDNGVMTGFQKDGSGQTVISKMDEQMLAKIADETHGKYYRLGQNNQQIDVLNKDLAKMTRTDEATELFDNPVNLFQWFLGGALLLIFLEFLLTDRKSRINFGTLFGSK